MGQAYAGIKVAAAVRPIVFAGFLGKLGLEIVPRKGFAHWVAGENELARDHLELAETDPKTKQRASRALRELPPE
ncbi:MAG: hypothetical protein JRE73_12525 [Deltaproteobacteria bacterium]|nr:hypothetical protein [Deltaproteobacteria bacterium]